MRWAPGGETQALSRYGLIPRTRAIASPDSSLLRHWLSHHLRSWVDPVGLHIAPYPRIDRNSIQESHSPVGDHTIPHVKVRPLKVQFHSSIGEFALMLSDGSQRTPATPPSSEISSSPGSRANLGWVALNRCFDGNGTLSIKIDLPFSHIDSFPSSSFVYTYDYSPSFSMHVAIFKSPSLRESWRPACLRLRSARQTKPKSIEKYKLNKIK